MQKAHSCCGPKNPTCACLATGSREEWRRAGQRRGGTGLRVATQRWSQSIVVYKYDLALHTGFTKLFEYAIFNSEKAQVRADCEEAPWRRHACG